MSGKAKGKYIRPRRRKRLPVLLVYNLDPVWPVHDIQEAVETSQQLGRALQRQGHAVALVQVRNGGLEDLLQAYRPEDWVLFNWCESLPGIKHSEARAARIIQSMNFVYTGATPDALEFNWNKHQTKQLLAMENVSTPRWRFYDANTTDGWNCFPAIVKLANEHCSLGVTTESVVMNRRELKRRIRHVQQTYRQPALVEDFIDGREFHVTLWGNEEVRMLPPVEMDFSALNDIHDRLCTQGAKFDSNSLHYRKIITLFEAKLSQAEYALLERTCIQAYRLAGCRDYARIDLRLRDGVFYVLDINPNSDLTAEASSACAAAQAGYSYGAMGSQIVHLAARRHPAFADALD